MSKLTKLLEMLKALPADDFKERERCVTYVTRELNARFRLCMPGTRRAYGDFVFAEFERVAARLPSAACYEETDTLCTYADALVDLMMSIVKSPKVPSMPPEQQTALLERLRTLINNARALEYAVDNLFDREENNQTVTEYDMRQVLDIVFPMTEQYHRNVLLRGLLHYSDKLSRLTLEAEQVMQVYLYDEMRRLRDLGDAMTADDTEALELAADLCAFFLNDDLLEILYTLPALGRSNISFFVLYTLVGLKKDIPDGLVDALAQDIEWADETKNLLDEHNLGNLFPAAYDDPVLLARARLVHWLVYPTELGKQPDEIEYITAALGRIPEETYYIFRFRSDSDTLDDERKGVWLVGWSSGSGESFSSFDKLSDCERETPEKTAAYVKKHLIK